MQLLLIVWGAKRNSSCVTMYLSVCLSLISPSVCSVWHEWVIENDTYTGMYYTMGESCSTSDREAKVSNNGGELSSYWLMAEERSEQSHTQLRFSYTPQGRPTTMCSNDTLVDTSFQLISDFFHANQSV